MKVKTKVVTKMDRMNTVFKLLTSNDCSHITRATSSQIEKLVETNS